MVPSSVEVGDEEVASVRAVVCIPQRSLAFREHALEVALRLLHKRPSEGYPRGFEDDICAMLRTSIAKR